MTNPIAEYRKSLESFSDEELGYEFADKMPNGQDFCEDFQRMMFHSGRAAVVDYLVDIYTVEQYEEEVSK